MVKKFEKVWVDGSGNIRSKKIEYKKRGKYTTDQRFYDFFDKDSVSAFIYNTVKGILTTESDKNKIRTAYSISRGYYKKASKEKNPILKRSYERIAKFFYKLSKNPPSKWDDML